MSDNPTIFPRTDIVGQHGITLRDHFAGLVLLGFSITPRLQDENWYAKAAYEAADAMLAQRTKGDVA